MAAASQSSSRRRLAFLDCGGVGLMLSRRSRTARQRASTSTRSSITRSTTFSRPRALEARGVVFEQAPPRVAGPPHAELWMGLSATWIATCSRSCARCRQPELPGFGDEVLAEAAMRFLVDAAEAGLGVQAARRVQLALRPERQRAIAGVARKADAFLDQPASDAEPARGGLDEQQPQLRHRLRFPDDEHRADDRAVAFRDPAALAARVEMIEEVGADPRDERLELGVVAPLARVDRAVTLDDPAHVAGLMAAQQVRRGVGTPMAEPSRDRVHRLDHLLLLTVAQPSEQRRHLGAGAGLERGEGGGPFSRELQQALARVGGRRRAADEPPCVEPAEDPPLIA